VDNLKGDELVVCRGAAGDEEEGGISTIDYFGIWVLKSAELDIESLPKPLLAFVFQEVAHTRSSREHKLGHILDDLGFVFGRQCGEPFGKTLEIDFC